MRIKSPEDFHNKLGFIFHGLLAGPLAAFVYLFLEMRHRNLQPALSKSEMTDILIAGLILVAATIAVTGYYFYRKDKKIVNGLDGLRDKLKTYFSALVKFYVFIAISSIFLVAGLYLSASAVFIGGYVFLLFILSLNRPSLQKYVNDLRLTKDEKNAILRKQPFSSEQ